MKNTADASYFISSGAIVALTAGGVPSVGADGASIAGVRLAQDAPKYAQRSEVCGRRNEYR